MNNETGGMNAKGKTKLIEECGELVTVIAKADAFGSLGEHWDGKGSLKIRLEHEIADVEAACEFLATRSELDVVAIEQRKHDKLTLFWFWDAGGRSSKLPELMTYVSNHPYCHEGGRMQRCDWKGNGNFMGHTCRPDGYYANDQIILRRLIEAHASATGGDKGGREKCENLSQH